MNKVTHSITCVSVTLFTMDFPSHKNLTITIMVTLTAEIGMHLG